MLSQPAAISTAAITARQGLPRASHATGCLLSNASVIGVAGVISVSDGVVPPARVQSRRPLDQRWDRSRGICFSQSQSSSRPAASARGQYWLARSDARTARTPSTPRTYATKGSIRKPAGHLNNPHQSAGPTDTSRTQDLALRIDRLTADLARTQTELETATTEKQELQVHLDGTVAALDKALSQRETFDQGIQAERQRWEEGNKEKAARDEQRRQDEHDALLSKLTQETRLVTKKLQSSALDAEAEDRRRNKIRLDHGLAGLASQAVELEQKRQDLKKEMEEWEESRRVSGLEQLGRRKYRETYPKYRIEWVKLDDPASGLVRNQEHLIEANQNAATFVQVSVTGMMARQDPTFSVRFPSLRAKLDLLVKKRSDELGATCNTLKSMLAMQRNKHAAMQSISHRSRSVTRHLRMSDPSNLATALLVSSTQLEWPLSKWRDENRAEMKLLEDTMQDEKMDSASVTARREELKGTNRLLRRRIQVTARTREHRALEELLEDDLVEKHVYVTLLEINDHIDEAEMMWRDIMNAPSGNQKQDDQKSNARSSKDQLRDDRQVYEAMVRRKFLLDQRLGTIPGNWEKFLDDFIKRELEKKRVQQAEALEEVGLTTLPTGRGMRTRGPDHVFSRERSTGPRSLKLARPEASSGRRKPALAVKPTRTGDLKLKPARRAKTSSRTTRMFRPTSKLNGHFTYPFAALRRPYSPPNALAERMYPTQAHGLHGDASTASTALPLAGHAALHQYQQTALNLSVRNFISQDSHSSLQQISPDEISPPLDNDVNEIMTNSDMMPKADCIVDAGTRTSFQIPPQDYRNAVLASRSSNAAYWSYKLYRDAMGAPPALFYCTTIEQAEKQAQKFMGEAVVGFDLEWEPYAKGTGSIKQNVSLIQIACEDKIGLFHVALFRGETAEELMPPSLRAILESNQVLKAGVNITGDARRMQQFLGVAIQGQFELSHLYRVVKYNGDQPKEANRKLVSMAFQVQDTLLLPLKKDEVRVSAWSKKLNTQQTEYAGSDAYAGFRLFNALEAKRLTMSPVPPRPAHYELSAPLVFRNGRAVLKSAQLAPPTTAVQEKVIEPDQSGDEEFFDAEETLGSGPLDPQPVDHLSLAGLQISYPALPPPGDEHTARTTITAYDTPIPGTSPKFMTARPPRREPLPASETEMADSWAVNWRTTLPSGRTVTARHAELRAYHLWQFQGLSVTQVAAALRDPPLAQTTVASYILQAIKEEGLAYDVRRVAVVLAIVPESVHGRYRKIAQRVERQL